MKAFIYFRLFFKLDSVLKFGFLIPPGSGGPEVVKFQQNWIFFLKNESGSRLFSAYVYIKEAGKTLTKAWSLITKKLLGFRKVGFGRLLQSWVPGDFST